MNAARSHAVFTIELTQKIYHKANPIEEADLSTGGAAVETTTTTTTSSKLTFVDLAGSERIKELEPKDND